jgi:hypothetical protein
MSFKFSGSSRDIIANYIDIYGDIEKLYHN